jgi:hypothetical protein
LYDLLLDEGISKTSITRLKSGDFNLSKIEGEILYKKKIFFKQQPAVTLLSSIECLSKEERIVKNAPRFAVVTDYKNLVAKELKLGKNLAIFNKDLPNHYAFFLPLAGSEVYHSTNDNKNYRNAVFFTLPLTEANPLTLLFLESPVPPPKKEPLLRPFTENRILPTFLYCNFMTWGKNRLPRGKIPVAAGKNPVENWERMFNLRG